MATAERTLLMKVEGMTCQGCVNAVTRTIQRLDPQARVAVDLAGGRVEANTSAEPEAVTQALAKAGYEAQALGG